MDKMHRLFAAPETTGAGLIGMVISGVGVLLDHLWAFVGSDELHRVVGNILMIVLLISACIALGSTYYRTLSQKHKERTDEINEAIAQAKLCERCKLAGIATPHCPLPPEERSWDCPERILSKFSGIDPKKGIPP